MPPPALDGALVKKVMTAQSTAALAIEIESPSGGMVEEVGQVVKGTQLILPLSSLVVQDFEAPQPLVF